MVTLNEMAVVWSVFLGAVLIFTGGAFGYSQSTKVEHHSITKPATTNVETVAGKETFTKPAFASTGKNLSLAGMPLSGVTHPSFITSPSASEMLQKNAEITSNSRVQTKSRQRCTTFPSFSSSVSVMPSKRKREDSSSTTPRVIQEDAVLYVKTIVDTPLPIDANKNFSSIYHSYGTINTKMKSNATRVNNGSLETIVKHLPMNNDDLVQSSRLPFDVTLPAAVASWSRSSNESEPSSATINTSIDVSSVRRSILNTLTIVNFTAEGASLTATTTVTESTPTTLNNVGTVEFASTTSNANPNNNNVKPQSSNNEYLQFPAITLKVSHVLIPKQKRSRYYVQTMKVELPKPEISNRSAATNDVPPKSSNNSKCIRFPVQVVTVADTESNEKLNLTEEHYDCEFSSRVQSTQQRESIDSIRTYYGGYVFRYTIPKISNNISRTTDNQTTTEAARSTQATTVEDNDYDSSYLDYADTVNGSNNSGNIEDTVFPDPVIRNAKAASNIQVKPETYSVSVSDSSSLMDSDIHDHDVIDSVMYIYFGGASHGQRGAGRQIIIVGAVIALVAQFLTIASCIRRIKTHKGEEPTIILLNVETALTLTNLIFTLGVQSTGNQTLCTLTSVSLYYLHLATLTWFLLSSLYSVQIVCQIKPSCTFFKYCVCGWLIPSVTTLLSYLLNERSFETSLYCWVSPHKGILFSFILPVILLCIICILLTVYGLKRVSEPVDDVDDTYSHRKLLRIAAVALPLFSVIWFTGMVALENSTSLLFSLIFLISDTVLNWLLFACWLPSEASQWKDMDEDYYDDDEDFDDELVLVKRRFDDQLLLSELYEYGAQGQLYNFKSDPISIISIP